MSETNQSQRPWFFNLINDGDTAVVRLLHSSTDTIEVADTHRMKVGGKTKRIKCVGDGCPLCAEGESEKRIFIHLWDYTDAKEKVWDRTDKIIPQLVQLQQSWNPLSSAVIKITRKGTEFPKYEIEVQNPMNYENTSLDLIDKKVAKMFYMNRSSDDIKTFLSSGEFPEKKAYISKEEYAKSKEVKEEPVAPTTTPSEDNFDPFM